MGRQAKQAKQAKQAGRAGRQGRQAGQAGRAGRAGRTHQQPFFCFFLLLLWDWFLQVHNLRIDSLSLHHTTAAAPASASFSYRYSVFFFSLFFRAGKVLRLKPEDHCRPLA
jgi:hypothetical protein